MLRRWFDTDNRRLDVLGSFTADRWQSSYFARLPYLQGGGFSEINLLSEKPESRLGKDYKGRKGK